MYLLAYLQYKSLVITGLFVVEHIYIIKWLDYVINNFKNRKNIL